MNRSNLLMLVNLNLFASPLAAQFEHMAPSSALDCVQLTFPELDGKAKGGPPQRIIQIAYLDKRIR